MFVGRLHCTTTTLGIAASDRALHQSDEQNRLHTLFLPGVAANGIRSGSFVNLYQVSFSSMIKRLTATPVYMSISALILMINKFQTRRQILVACTKHHRPGVPAPPTRCICLIQVTLPSRRPINSRRRYPAHSSTLVLWTANDTLARLPNGVSSITPTIVCT